MGLSVKFLLDTNVISEMARVSPNHGVEARMQTHELACAICALTIEELAFGIARLPASRKRDLLSRWLDGVRGAPRADGEIASVAVINDLVLVTRNTADFQNFARLKIENWFEA